MELRHLRCFPAVPVWHDPLVVAMTATHPLMAYKAHPAARGLALSLADGRSAPVRGLLPPSRQGAAQRRAGVTGRRRSRFARDLALTLVSAGRYGPVRAVGPLHRVCPPDPALLSRFPRAS